MSKYTDEEIELIVQSNIVLRELNDINNKMIDKLKDIVKSQDKIITIVKDHFKIPSKDGKE